MTNNTIANVPGELREILQGLIAIADKKLNGRAGSPNHRHDIPGVWDSDNGELAGKPCAECAIYDAARALLSAPSPAGVDGLEVVGYVSQDDIQWQGDCTLRLKPYSDYVIPLCRLSAAQAIIDGLRGESERIRLNIAEYNEAIACYQFERDQQAQRIGELASHLEFAVTMLTVAGLAGNAQVEAMRAALSAGVGRVK